jgi:hypothetical protein
VDLILVVKSFLVFAKLNTVSQLRDTYRFSRRCFGSLSFLRQKVFVGITAHRAARIHNTIIRYQRFFQFSKGMSIWNSMQIRLCVVYIANDYLLRSFLPLFTFCGPISTTTGLFRFVTSLRAGSLAPSPPFLDRLSFSVGEASSAFVII